MTLANVLLVRYAYGWHEVVDAASVAAYGRHEAFLSLGAAQSTAEVERVAAALFTVQAAPRVSTTVGLEPTGAGDDPYVDFDVADYVTAPDETGAPAPQRVLGLTVTEDAEGNPVFAPELSSLADELDSRLQRWLKRMADGTLGGTAESATPAAPTAAASGNASATADVGEQTFSLQGAVYTAVSGRYWPQRAGRLLDVTANVDVAGTTDTVLDVRLDGSTVGTVTIPAGSTAVEYLELTDTFDGPRIDHVTVAVTSAGAGARDLVVQVRFLYAA